jgi:hypothetical protein
MNKSSTGDSRNRVLALSAAVGGGIAKVEEQTELTSLLEKYPDLKRDSRLIMQQTRTFEDNSFMETCLQVLLGGCSDQDLAGFAKTCRQDRKRWLEYCRARNFLEELGNARSRFSKMSESEKQPSPGILDSIWRKFQATKTEPSKSRR